MVWVKDRGGGAENVPCFPKMWLVFKKTWEIFGKSSDFFDEISHVFMAYFLPLGLDVVLSNSKAVEPSPRSTRWALNFLPALF